MQFNLRDFNGGRLTSKLAVALLLVLVSATLISAPKSPFTENDRAFYADANTVNFVRPGLVFRILSASIAADGTITTRVRVTDPRGLGLDRLGVTTPGTVSMSFIAATIPAGQTQYVAYTTRTQTSPITGKSAIQATGQNNGTFTQVGDGEYTYTFSVKAPSTINRSVTHTIGVYGSRSLTEFDLGTYYADATFDFVPDGSPVSVTRDVIKNQTCNKCHYQLSFHGGSRRSIELCILCHTPQTTDPDTGNTVNMVEMIHKIHTGANLPSVRAGGKYVIIGHNQSVHDYSKIVFSANGLTANCTVCHESGKGAKQQDAWLKPTRTACGSCHDDVNFATGAGHLNLPQVSDSQCANCHTPQGELEFDASIKGAHTNPTFSKELPGTVFEIVSVTNTGAGQKPTVRFNIKDRSGAPIAISAMTRLAIVLAGPTTDYQTMVSENGLTATGSAGQYTYTFNAAIPANAKGSYTIGLEGYRNWTLLRGTTKEQTVRDAAINVVRHFSVDGSAVKNRREIVSIAKCNACHDFLSLHGGNRNRIEQCVLCHNPVTTDTARRPSNMQPAESVDFRAMIHRIHTGHELTYDYTVYGFGNTPHNYNHVGFPGDRRVCDMCHVNNSQQLPLPLTNINVIDPRGPLSPMGPTTAACTSCHTQIYAASHALANTTQLGESCAACHGPNATYSVNRAHAR